MLLLLLLLLLLLWRLQLPLPETERPAYNADPEGAAHGWVAFSDRARMASRKIPAHSKPRAVDVSGRRFSLVPFLLGSTKRNELGRASGRKRLTLLFVFRDTRKIKRFHSPRGERVHFFCWPKRNGTKEKGQPRRSKSGQSFVPGFFDSPSWLGRKTPHIHVRRPMGLRTCAQS